MLIFVTIFAQKSYLLLVRSFYLILAREYILTNFVHFLLFSSNFQFVKISIFFRFSIFFNCQLFSISNFFSCQFFFQFSNFFKFQFFSSFNFQFFSIFYWVSLITLWLRLRKCKCLLIECSIIQKGFSMQSLYY